MKLKVLRFSSQEDSTSGLLFLEDECGELSFLCYTLEDEYRYKKVMKETRVPAGTYDIILRKHGRFHERYSDKFSNFHGGMLHIINVPNFKYILIHCGNTDEDTAGCLLLGDSQKNNIVYQDGYVGSSVQSYTRVYPIILDAFKRGEKVTIEFQDLA